jgi:hypothetical protein
MIVHLIRSDEYADEKFWQVMDLLRKFPGPLQFRTQEFPVSFSEGEIHAEDFDSKKFERKNQPVFEVNFVSAAYEPPQKIYSLSWNDIFEKCRAYRLEHDIGDDEFVVLLTEYGNEFNWFSAANPKGTRDMFVQTSNWDFFLGSDQRYPVAYQLSTGILKQLIFRDYKDLQSCWHEQPRGCMMDFCRDKKEITFKMRTGDICHDCLDLFHKRGVNHDVVAQVFDIIDGIRTQMMYKDRFVVRRNPPQMHIVGRNKKMIFPEMGDLQLSLNPLEKTVYLFFLNHPEGVELNFVQDYRAELETIYSGLSNSDNRALIQSRIDDLVNHPLSNSLSEKISRIKRKLIELLGESIASYFIISGENASPKKILLERSKIVYSD